MGLLEDLPAFVFLLFGIGVGLWGFWPDLKDWLARRMK